MNTLLRFFCIALAVACATVFCVTPTTPLYGYGLDDGGRCPRCGKMTMRGATHICKARKRKSSGFYFGKGESSNEDKPAVAKPKVGDIPDVLKSSRGTFSEDVISTEPRAWTDDKKRVIQASWSYIAEDKGSIWIQSVKTGKLLHVMMKSLSPEDRRFVNDYAVAEEAKNKVWFRGVYADEKDVEAFEQEESAKKMIRDKDDFAWKIDSLTVVQALGKDALCEPHPNIAGRNLVKFVPSDKKLFATDESIKGRFFWCGTYTYQANGDYRGPRENTVNCVSDNPEFALSYLADHLNGTNASQSGDATPQSPNQGSYSFFASGSGFFITEDGYLITNHHVIDGGKKLAIKTHDGNVVAKLIRSDRRTDLALLKVDGIKAKPFKFASRRTEKVGTAIFTMGFPLIQYQGFDPKVTRGIISCESGFKGDMQRYQIDASIQAGNSGGPLFNEHGCVVGVIVSSLAGNDVQNVNYAIKKTHLLAFIENCPECSNGIIECDDCGSGGLRTEDVISSVRDSCVLVLNYQ